MPIYGQSQNNLLQIQHQCYPVFSQSLSISLLFSTIAAFIVVSYCGYTEVLWKKKSQPEQGDVESETSSPWAPEEEQG